MRTLFFCLLLLASATLPARPLLVASIEPLSLALRELYGDTVTVQTLMLPQQTPHQAAFTPGQARQVQAADLLVWLGPSSEPALARLLARRDGPLLALESVQSLVRLTASAGGHDDNHDHSHQPADAGTQAHQGASIDPHLWLSPQNMAQLAQALVTQTPALPEARRDAFLARLRDTDQALQQRLAAYRQVPWLSAHDPWLYFHRHYGLQAPQVISPGLQSGASARHFATLLHAMDEQQIHCAIAEPEAGRALLARLCRAPECHIEALDPLARDAAYGSYTRFLAQIGEGFARCLDQQRWR